MKGLGSALIGLALSLPGILMALETGRRNQKERAMMDFWENIFFQIKTFNRAQKDLFFSYKNAYLEKTGFLHLLRESVSENPVGALGRVLEAYLSSAFRPTLKEETLAVAKRFGLQSKRAQLYDLEALCALYRREVKEKEKDNTALSRLYLICGIAVGAGVWILLL